jgi:hypothetical protein
LRSDDGGLLCPRCGREYPPSERFCADCGIPLAHAGAAELAPSSPEHEMARKIRPGYARGRLRRVAVARNLAEAELIAGVLLEQGIPSMIRRTGGFDVPDFLAGGPRDVLVPEGGLEAAQELLTDIDAAAASAAPAQVAFGPGAGLKIAAALLAALLAFGAIAGMVWLFIR